MASDTGNSLHLLSIDLGSAPNSLRAVLELGPGDVEHWLKRAKAAGAPLAIVCGPETVDLYSTEAGRRTAFKPLLESLWSLGRNLEGFEQIRTRVAYGHAVVRHMLRQAAGLESTEHGLSYAACIGRARAQAADFGTLGDALRQLFELASSTADRSENETQLSAPHSTRASRQIEALTAERIMEEEIIAFRVAAANDEAARSSVPAPRNSVVAPTALASVLPFSANEPGSCMRMRVAPFSLAPVSTRKSAS
jgi:Glutamyl-tRNAGlu reductase, N-terminal domain